MSIPDDSDRRFHENLQAIGRHMPVPEPPTGEVRGRCMAEFDSVARSPRAIFKRPAVLSTLGLAACLALVVGVFFPGNGGTTVQAATILARLNEQIEEPEGIEITMQSIVIEEVSIDGKMQIAETGVAGDLHVIVTDDEDGPIEIDLAMALSEEQSWILIRKLEIPDPDVQPILTLFFPPGSETLLILPDDLDIGGLIGGSDATVSLGSTSILSGLSLAGIGGFEDSAVPFQLVEAFQELIRNQPGVGATITEQSDGTLLLTLPIQDAESLSQIVLMAVKAADEEGDVDLEEIEAELEADLSIDDDIGLFGSTISIVYDPETEQVRTFTLSDFGQARGTLSVDISGGIDPDMFDASRVTTPHTRTFDLAAFQMLLGQVDSLPGDD